MHDIEINPQVHISAAEISFKASRSSGPGGQHVNKTSSRISLFWHLWSSAALDDEQKKLIASHLKNRLTLEGFIVIHVESSRSQLQNKENALELLAELIKQALLPKKKRRATKPRKGAIERRIKEKVQHGQRKSERKKSVDW